MSTAHNVHKKWLAYGGVGPWQLRPMEGFAVAWLLVSAIFFSDSGASLLIHWANIKDSGLQTLILGVSMHLTLIFIWGAALLGNVFNVRVGFRGPSKMNTRSTALFMLWTIAGVGAISWSWESLLSWLHTMGWIPEIPQQSIIAVIKDVHSPWILAGLFIMACVLAPISEELIFRSGLYRYLKGKLATPVAIGLSAILFAALHFNILAFVPLVCLGIAFACLYENTGRIALPISLHGLFNALSFINLLLES